MHYVVELDIFIDSEEEMSNAEMTEFLDSELSSGSIDVKGVSIKEVWD